jgi:outer membrane protein assembly factor BamD (BamD/ComL family)/Na+-transporting methylmalonyl-CoA/oxaloacetate decarboxylase gamma subunit
MSNHSSTSIPSTLLFRGVAIAVLFLTITVCGLQTLAALMSMDRPTDRSASHPAEGSSSTATTAEPVAPVISLFVPVILTLTVGIALSTLLEGMARLITAQRPAEHSSSSGNTRLLLAISELQEALPGIIASAQASAVPMPVAPLAESAPLSPAIESHLDRMVKLLEEMKEVSMLDETQRQTRRKQLLVRRKTSRLEEAARFINRQNWEEADALLHLLESLHPGDADVQALRNQLNDARIATQADEWDRVRRNAEELLAASRYEDALLTTTAFLDRFPSHPDCQQLAIRIRSDMLAYVEASSNRLYEQIKSAVEARQWKTALECIQQFLEQYPQHPRSPKIRNQVRVIQKNAEIEERHGLEDQIRDLIAAKQWGPAAEMSEDLLTRFPDSPQSAYLTELLPKLRERAGLEASGVAG